MDNLILPAAAVGTAVAAIALWMRLIASVELGQKRWIVNSLVGGSAALGALALMQSVGTLGGILAGSAIAFGAIYFGLLAVSGQSTQSAAVAVGSPILDFSATDHNGDPFTLSSLNGKPILMKFFRGHW